MPNRANVNHPDAGDLESRNSEPPASADASMTIPSPPDPVQAAQPEVRPWPADCEHHQILTAHAENRAGDTRPHEVTPSGEYPVLFYFDANWTGDAQLLEARPIVDNPNVVHHWALWVFPNSQHRDGEIAGGPRSVRELEFDGQLLMAAGRGASDFQLPPGVGLQLGPAGRIKLGLEVHYFNPSADTPGRDASGVELCVTTHKRPMNAALHTLGRVNFEVPAHAATQVMGTCRPVKAAAPVHIAAVTPHLHRTGTRTTLLLNRKSGEQVQVLDAPYDFSEQRTHPLSTGEVVLNPGDTLTTICNFENRTDRVIAPGELNENEMCVIFALAWPAGGLSNGLPNGLFFGVPTEVSCLEF